MKEVLSPITKSSNVTFVKNINMRHNIKTYKRFNVDVAKYFSKIKNVSIYNCNDTGYKFYYPFNLSGDSAFYEHFQEFDWYYMPWKWEHEITKKYIKNDISLLEVGCAQGAFIKKITQEFKLNSTVGLELNESTVDKTKKWEIKNETIENYAEFNPEKFDVVCSYQVLEHISDVRSFLEAKIKCLKTGGKLIISVPNNDSFIEHADNCLNRPPHHMGLWNEESLRSLDRFFPLKVLDVHFEELQEYHAENFVSAQYDEKYENIIIKKGMRKLHKIFGLYQSKVKQVKAERQKHIGQTILVVYKKI